MRQRYLGDSVTVISPIDVLTDNTNKLYNNGGTLYFNGTEVGAGAEDNNAWVNANDYATYTTLSGLIDTVQDNVSAASDAAANDYNTYTTVTANTYDTYVTVSGLINTVNANVDALPDSAANDHTTYTTLSGLIDTVQDNVTANENNAWVNANDYTTYNTLSGLIDTVQDNVAASTGAWAESGDDIYYNTGAVTIGPGASYNPASNLYVYGNTYVSGNVEVGDTLIELSSMAIKTNIVPLRQQLSKIQLLNPVEYDKIQTNNHELGLIAEEVSQVLPHVVAEGNTAISYTRIVPVLIQAMKELKSEVDELKRKLNGST